MTKFNRLLNKKLALGARPLALGISALNSKLNSRLRSKSSSIVTRSNIVTRVATKKLMDLARRQANLELKTFKLASGESLVYAESCPNLGRTTGKASGAPLLLIHGFGGNMFNFIRISQEFSDYHVIIPDLLGFGESDKPMDADYRADAHAERLHELMQAKGLSSHLHIGGNSMGGAIAVAYAAKYPDTVASVWLIDSAGFWTVSPPEVFENSTPEDNPLLVSNYQDIDKLLKFTLYKTPYIPSFVKAVMAENRIKNRVLESTIIAQITDDNVEKRAEVIAEHQIPTLVVWGAKDAVIQPKTAEHIKSIIPQAKVIMMQEVGHVPVLEAVERSATDYKAFRSGLASV